MKRSLLALVGAVLVGAGPAGCSLGGDGDKAGGSNEPTVLRLGAADDADQPDARFVRYFASRVAELSDGSLEVRVTWDAAGQSSAAYEAHLARMVRGGRFQLGWIGARAWYSPGCHELPGPPGALPRHRSWAARQDHDGSRGRADAVGA